MRVMGIDPGLTRMGVAVLEDDARLRLVWAGTIQTSPDLPTAERLVALSDRLLAELESHRPEAVAIERVFFNLNAKTAIPVIQSSGVAMLAAARHGATVYEYTPLEVKQAVVGSGAASKDQVRYMVGRLLALAGSAAQADAADAMAIAVCHLHSRTIRSLEGALR